MIKPIDLILLDIQMPLKTGLEVIEAIETKINRMNLKYKNCFIAKPDFIVISAFIMPTVITHLAKIGVTQVHQKPLEFDTLKGLFDNYRKQHKLTFEDLRDRKLAGAIDYGTIELALLNQRGRNDISSLSLL